MRPQRKARLAQLLPGLRILLDDNAGGLDPSAWFAQPVKAVWLEIGAGAGEHLLAQARANPDIGLIAAEPYIGGVAGLLAALDPAEAAMGRVRLFVDDARILLGVLADASIDRMFILFPDPWPKRRHHRRRVVSRETLAAIVRVLRPGGELRLATDHGEYGRWMLAHALGVAELEWLAERCIDWQRRTPDWPPTRYEAKAKAAGRPCLFLRFRRRAAD